MSQQLRDSTLDEKWRTSKLPGHLAGDIAAAGISATLVSPLITAIDRLVRYNFSHELSLIIRQGRCRKRSFDQASASLYSEVSHSILVPLSTAILRRKTFLLRLDAVYSDIYDGKYSRECCESFHSESG
jgi:hypothetical protein